MNCQIQLSKKYEYGRIKSITSFIFGAKRFLDVPHNTKIRAWASFWHTGRYARRDRWCVVDNFVIAGPLFTKYYRFWCINSREPWVFRKITVAHWAYFWHMALCVFINHFGTCLKCVLVLFVILISKNRGVSKLAPVL